ncbi:MAG: NAD(P)-binding domain-containing protein [Pseudomonadota bacterium]
MTTFISFEDGEVNLTWLGLCEALERGHTYPRAQIEDTFLHRGEDTLLTRSAWIDGLGVAVKSTTVYPGNPGKGRPMIDGTFSLYRDDDGRLEAVIDFFLVTKWKTAGDSLLAATRLARPDSEHILIIGAGVVAQSLFEAYSAAFPKARFMVWNRTRTRAEEMAQTFPGIEVAEDLEQAVRRADIVTSATPSTEPVIKGDWLRPGQHIDLIGAFTPPMREADDAVLQRGRIFADTYDTILGHIGEIQIPLDSGAITQDDLGPTFYDADDFRREAEDDITVFKNGGGAHLDLMTGRYILEKWRANQ